MNTKKKKTGRGGARKGAGRPRVIQKPCRLDVIMEESDAKACKQAAKAAGVTTMQWMRLELIQAAGGKIKK